jgi:hypothetical protein
MRKRIWLLLLMAPLGLLSQVDTSRTALPDTSGATRIPFPKYYNQPGNTLQDSSLQDSILQNSSLQDSLKEDPRKALQERLKRQSDFKSSVTYTARDSSVLDVPSNTLYLYGEVEVKYEDINLKAARVWLNFDDQTLFAIGVEDSSGEMSGEPVFSQGEQQFSAREISYNFNTDKGVIAGARTKQGEGDVLADRAKKQPDGSIHIKGGKYTTCDLDHPHYYIESRKLKLIPGKQVISGPLRLVIEDFPIPFYVPFGFFPTNTGSSQRNGIVLPQYGEANDRGFFLRGLGYYRGLGDYADVLVEGDIYTRGGWRLGLRTNYNVRYKFSGSFSADYSVQQFGESTDEFTDPDFSKTSGWRITWNHRQPISPKTNFSASVNLSNSRFLQRLSYDPNDVLTNTLNSSINFSTSFAPFNLTVAATHRQDVRQQKMDITLPNANLQMTRQQPFKRVRGKGLDFLRQFGITYGMEATNQVNNLPDSLLGPIFLNPGGQSLLINPEDTTDVEVVQNNSFFRRGIRHRSTLGTSARILKYINIPINFNIREYWYFEELRRVYNRSEGTTEDISVPGFYTARDFNFSTSAQTTLYAFYELPKTKREIIFRQQLIPSVGYSLNPDFSDPRFGYFRKVQTNREGDTTLYNRFQNGVYGSPSPGESQSMSFGLSSVLEMKYRKKESFEPDWDESKDKFERVRILDRLSVNSSYNFAADSFNLAPFSMAGQASLFNRKFNINASASLDPYALAFSSAEDTVGFRVNTFAWDAGQGLGRISNARVSMNTRFSSKQSRSKTRSENFDQREYEMIRNQLYDYVDFDVPWSVQINYNLQYTRSNAAAPRVTQTLRLSGDFSLTPQWKITYNTGYDFTNKEVTLTRFSVKRDLHCWDMSFDVTPFGSQQSYVFTLQVRSATLKDLRLTKQSRWQDRAFN